MSFGAGYTGGLTAPASTIGAGYSGGLVTPSTSDGGGALADQPGANPLVVGPVTFTSRQCPAKLDLGAGEQLVVDTKITGGTRIVESFGGFYKNVRFTGTLWEDGSAIYLQLDAIRVAGQQVLISWAGLRFYGIIIDLVPGARNVYRYEFEIEFIILQAAGTLSATGPTDLDSVVNQASTNATSAYSSLTAIDSTASTTIPSSLLTNVTAAIKAAGALAQTVGTSAGAAILSAVALASTAVNTYLGGLTSFANGYVAATTLANNLTLIARNVQQGQSPTATQQLGGSYFAASVLAYGTIDNGIALADANGASSVRISNSILTTIPNPPLQSAA